MISLTQNYRARVFSHKNRYAGQGFTLLEILMVMIIIGVVASSFVYQTIDTNNKLLKAETTRLKSILNLIADEAIYQGVELGLYLAEEENRFFYEIWYFDEDEQLWMPKQDKDFHTFHVLEKGIQMELEVEDILVDLPESMVEDPGLDNEYGYDERNYHEQMELDNESNKDSYGIDSKSKFGKDMPPLVFLSSGEMTPFILRLFITSDDNENIGMYELIGDGISRIRSHEVVDGDF